MRCKLSDYYREHYSLILLLWNSSVSDFLIELLQLSIFMFFIVKYVIPVRNNKYKYIFWLLKNYYLNVYNISI